MTEQEEKDKLDLLLKSARVSINASLLVMLLGGVIILYGLFGSNLNSGDVEKAEVDQDTSVQTYAIDPTEIVDGIHVPSGLIADDGFELLLNTCAQCHSLDLVKQNRATEQGWKEMIVWMQETQGLWDLGENETPILTYLSKNYAPENTGRRKNLENIEWYSLKN